MLINYLFLGTYNIIKKKIQELFSAEVSKLQLMGKTQPLKLKSTSQSTFQLQI